jgi:hypothetical protein
MASSNYDIPAVFHKALETLLYTESYDHIKKEAASLKVDPRELFDSIKPHLKYGIPSAFWESFEPLLKGRVTGFIKECARVLEVDPNKLLRAVMNAKDVRGVYIQKSPDEAIDCACRAYVELASGDFAARCFLPTIPGSMYCNQHTYFRPSLQFRIDQGLPIPKEYERLKSSPDRPELWVDPLTDAVYNANLESMGYYNRTLNKLILIKK